MSKSGSYFLCQQCGYKSTGWLGKCPECSTWGSLVETIETPPPSGNKNIVLTNIKPVALDRITNKKLNRVSTKSTELDRILGGGIVAGQVTLVAGEPGIGKSTLLIQLANKLAQSATVYYVSGEESAFQIALRAERLGIKNKKIAVLETTDIDQVIAHVESLDPQPLACLIVDSIQTMQTTDLSGLSGSIGQVRECTFRLVRLAKRKEIPVFIVGHVTKEGAVAGPNVLAHIVDTVLWFEGDKSTQMRIIRAIKNRFGPTDEIGIFEMTQKGLTSLTNADRIFLTHGTRGVSGSVVSVTMQGTRPMLVEIQSLTTPVKSAFPKRIAQGIDPKRLELLIAILIQRCGLPLYDFDVFVNVTGGIKLEENACDLAVALSIASSYFDHPLNKGCVAVGEMGLLGEIREVIALDKRVKEAGRLGFKEALTSKSYSYLTQIIKKYLKH